MRRRDPGHIGFRAWGGYPLGFVAIAAASGMVVFALLQPAPTSQGVAFKWVLLLAWALLGYGLYRTQNRSSLAIRSEEHTSELQSLMRISYAVFCLQKKKLN